jgi:ferredoxin
VAYVICEPCIGVKDASCVDVCPVNCIFEADDHYFVDPDVCLDCGACVTACPVEAIYAEVDVPPQWTGYIEKNRRLADSYRRRLRIRKQRETPGPRDRR